MALLFLRSLTSVSLPLTNLFSHLSPKMHLEKKIEFKESAQVLSSVSVFPKRDTWLLWPSWLIAWSTFFPDYSCQIHPNTLQLNSQIFEVPFQQTSFLVTFVLKGLWDYFLVGWVKDGRDELEDLDPILQTAISRQHFYVWVL